jgi:O-antigen/teichoic acid export membrane protein
VPWSVVSGWLSLPKGTEPVRFQKSLFGDIWKMASGMGGIWFITLLLWQIDKVVLVKILPLETFGYYAIANLVATGVYRLILPIFQAYLPKLTQLAEKDNETLTRVYHQGSQVMALAILPISTMLIFFPREIIFLWQQNAETAAHTSFLVTLLTIGYALSSLIYLPYALQLAFGWTRLYFYVLLITLILSIPAIVLMSLYFDVTGAAIVIIAIYLLPLLVLIPLMHRRILPDQMWKWLWEDVSLPLIGSVVIGSLGRIFFVDGTSQIMTIIQLGIVSMLTFGTACVLTPYSRRWLLERIPAK